MFPANKKKGSATAESGKEPQDKSVYYKLQFLFLILGVIFSGILAMVVDSSVKDAISKNAAKNLLDIQKTVRQDIEGLQNALYATTAFLSHWDGKSFQDLPRILPQVVPNYAGISRLFVVYQSEGDKWKVQPVYEARQVKSQVTDKEADQVILGHFIKTAPKIKGGMSIVTDYPGQRLQKSETEFASSSYPFWAAMRIDSDKFSNGILIAHMDMMWMIDKDWLENRSDIHRISINDLNTKKILYTAERFDSKPLPFDASLSFMFQAGANDWRIEIVQGLSQKAKYMTKLSFVVFFVGEAITILLLLYFRHYRRTSWQRKHMGHELMRHKREIKKRMAEKAHMLKTFKTSENEYKRLINIASDIIFEMNEQGEIVFVNRAWERLMGHSPDEIKGQRMLDCLHEYNREAFSNGFDAVLKGKEKSYNASVKLRMNDGAYRATEIWMSTLKKEEEGSDAVIVGSIADAEEARRAKEALTLAEQKAQDIITNAAGGFYQVTLEGKFLSVNPSMAHILGFESPDHLMKHKDDPQNYLFGTLKDKNRFMRELEETEHVKNFEAKIYTRRGHEIWVNQNARAVKDDHGNIQYIEGSLENITQRKMVEMDLKEAKITSDLANRSKSEFLANMSHELRTPLNSIIGFAEIMKNEVLGKMENKQYWEYSRDIYESGKRLLMIINEILDVSRIESGERQLNETSIQMGGLITSCIEFVSMRSESNDVTVVNACENKVPNVLGEERGIKQVLLNLLSNAMKFTPSGGRVTISYEIDANHALRISITDTGVGLNEDEIAKALSPFGQVDTALSRSGSGAGLGLNLVDAMMTLHGGKFELFSEKGIGTTATVIFPSKRVLDGNQDAAGEQAPKSQIDYDAMFASKSSSDKAEQPPITDDGDIIH